MEMDFGLFTLKDGRTAHIRTIEEKDAAEIIALVNQVDTETRFLSREPGEFTVSLEKEQARIIGMRDGVGALWLKAVVDNRIAGIFEITTNQAKVRVKHKGRVGICILREYWGLGIGRLFFNQGIAWARENGIEQLELEVVAGNTRAIHLYESVGFVRFGTRKNGMKYPDGTYAEEYLMAMRL